MLVPHTTHSQTVSGKILVKQKDRNNMTENKPRLLDQVRQVIRVKHYSLRTEVDRRHHLYDTVVQKENK